MQNYLILIENSVKLPNTYMTYYVWCNYYNNWEENVFCSSNSGKKYLSSNCYNQQMLEIFTLIRVLNT